MQRIAVWNTAFLGDAALTLPLLRTLSAAFPAAELDFYVRRGIGPLFAAQPELSRLYEYDKRETERGFAALFRLGRTLAARRYDLWISPHESPRSAVLARCSGAARRVGYADGILRRLCYTTAVSRRFGEIEEIERMLELARPVLPAGFSFEGAFGPGPDAFCRPARAPSMAPDPAPLPAPWPELVLPPEALARAEAFREARGDAPLLGMHPGSVWPTKRWLPSGFAEVARRAVAEGAEVLLFAGRSEKALAEEVVRLSGLAGHPRLHVFSATLSLPELAAFLGRLDCYLANDSGPMHLAWMLRTPVTALFGPTAVELGFTPRGPLSSVLGAPLACRPCGLHGHIRCPLGHHDCMRLIRPEDVWKDVEAKLRAGRSPRPPAGLGGA